MSYRIQQLSDETIFILSITGGFEARDVQRAMADQMKRSLNGHKSQVIRIIDARYMDHSYTPGMLRLIADLRKGTGIPNAPGVQLVLVGRPELLILARSSGMNLPVFTSLEKAIVHARTQMAPGTVAAPIEGAGEVLQ